MLPMAETKLVLTVAISFEFLVMLGLSSSFIVSSNASSLAIERLISLSILVPNSSSLGLISLITASYVICPTLISLPSLKRYSAFV